MLEETNVIVTLVEGVINSVTSVFSLTDLGLILAALISASITFVFAWKFARKGYKFIVNALSGRGGKI